MLSCDCIESAKFVIGTLLLAKLIYYRETWWCKILVRYVQRAFSGHWFLLFLVQQVNRRCWDREEGVAVTSGCRSCRTENTFFSGCTGFHVSSCSLCNFLFGHSSLLGCRCVFVVLTVIFMCVCHSKMLGVFRREKVRPKVSKSRRKNAKLCSGP